MKMLLVLALAASALLEAKDFGQRGLLFPIEEENLEEYFRKTGGESVARHLKEMQRQIEHPDSLGLPLAQVEKSHLVDLPGFGMKMLFIDGGDPSQVRWAKGLGDDFLWILVSGSPSDLEEEIGREIFFDQMGLYTNRLKIKEIPATAAPEEGKIRVTQIPVYR